MKKIIITLTTDETMAFLAGDKITYISEDYEHWYWYFNEYAKENVTISFQYWNKTEFIDLQSFKAIHMQEFQFKEVGNPIVKDNFTIIKEFTSPYDLDLMAKNDGLSRSELNEYFKSNDLSKPFAIIHTTDFRYK